MATFNKFNDFTEQLGLGRHNLSTDTLKVALTNTAPTSTLVALSEVTEIASGNGYTTGGTSFAHTWSETPAATGTLTASAAAFTATGSMATFRYLVFYNDSTTNDALIGWADYGSAISLLAAQTFTVSFGANLATLT